MDVPDERRRSRASTRRALRLLLLTVLELAAVAVHARSAPQPAVLPLTINGVDVGEVTVIFEWPDALVRVADLSAAGLRDFAGARRDDHGEEFVSLDSLGPAVHWLFDETRLRMVLVAPPSLLPRARTDLATGRPAGIVYTHDASAFLNYAVTVDKTGAATGFSEIGWSMGRALLYGSVSRQGDGAFVRGLTNVTVDDRRHLVRWVAGDAFASGGELGGGTFLAGLSVARDLDLDPYFYRYPGFGISGAVTTPTRADVYVNGQLVRQETLQPGLFDFTHLPIQNGSGETRVVLHDALGGERVLASSYYLSTELLAPGVAEYSYNLGVRRQNQGTRSFDYGDLVFLGTHRIGVSDRFTAGWRAEATRGVISAGSSGAFSFQPGQVELDAAASRERGTFGFAASVRTAVTLPRCTLGAYGRWTGAHYATISLPAALDRPILDTGAFAALSLGRFGSLDLDYSRQRWRDSGTARRVAVTYNAHLFDRVSASLMAARGRTAMGHDATQLFVNLNVSFGGSSTVNASWSHDENGSAISAGVQKAAPAGPGFGYRLSGTDGPGNARASTADGQVRTPFGVVQASYRRLGGSDSGYVTASGGLVAIGGSLFATRPVQQAYALIRIPGVAGVAGYSRNQESGRTDRHGDLLIPDLLPNYGNVLGIDDTDLPADYIVDAKQSVVAPPHRAGALVLFPVRRLRAFTGTVKVSFGDTVVVPAYGTLTITVGDTAHVSDIGSRGNVYFEDVTPGTRPARLLYLGIACDFQIVLPDATVPVVKLGELLCRSEQPAPPGLLPVDEGALALPPLPRALPTAPPPVLPPSSPASATPLPPTPPRASDPRPQARPTASDYAGRSPVYVVQIAAFQSRANAEAEAGRAAARTHTVAHVVEVDLGARGIWYRVVLGDFADTASALRFRALLAAGSGEVGGVLRMEGPSAGRP